MSVYFVIPLIFLSFCLFFCHSAYFFVILLIFSSCCLFFVILSKAKDLALLFGPRSFTAFRMTIVLVPRATALHLRQHLSSCLFFVMLLIFFVILSKAKDLALLFGQDPSLRSG